MPWDALLALVIKTSLQHGDGAALLPNTPWIPSMLAAASRRGFVPKPKQAGIIPKRLETLSPAISTRHYGNHLVEASLTSAFCCDFHWKSSGLDYIYIFLAQTLPSWS